MATYGKIEEFNPDSDDWQQYMERLEFYFVANAIEEEERRQAIFLSACGGRVYAVLPDLCQPDKPGDFALADLFKILSGHFTPKPSLIVERFKFHSKVRQQGQSVAVFVAELRRLTEHCGFGPALDDMIRDRLVCGINDDRIQRRLLSEPDERLTLARAVEIATSMEMAAKDVAELQQTVVEGAVHKVQPAAADRPRLTGCFRCGGNHGSADCRFSEVICHNCQKRGHLARKCRSTRQPRQNRGRARDSTHMLQDNDDDHEEEYAHMLYHFDDEESHIESICQ